MENNMTLAVKYRPSCWDDVCEQGSIKIILEQQLQTSSVKNAYLFCGPSGCGKTTCARIFANEINKGKGNPIEMDAASNSGVDDVRNITQNAKLKSLDSEYKIFIIDECHAISNTGWQAFLKLIEEPPKNTIFIFCTTDPQKIPKTILSRVQRYDFHRISQQGIVQRLWYILEHENITTDNDVKTSVEYIAKIADGGMRDAVTLMDKCLSFSDKLTLENVVKALGTVDYEQMKQLTDGVLSQYALQCIDVIEEVHRSGKDMKQFINLYTQFLLDIQKYRLTASGDYIQIPATDENLNWLEKLQDEDYEVCLDLLNSMVKLNSAVKWSQTPKYDLEAEILLFSMEDSK